MTLIGGLDFETTGLSVTDDRIIEIGLVLMELETGEEKLSFGRKVNPGIRIQPKALEVHGITDADVAGAQPFLTYATGLVAALMKAAVVVGHNHKRFDMPMLDSELARAGLPAQAWPPLFDTMLEGRGCTDDGKVPNLGELCYALDTPYDPALAHGAVYDVRVMLQAFRRGWQLGIFQAPRLALSAAA